jgi:malonyl CoA-acyl carrier protein transacylase
LERQLYGGVKWVMMQVKLKKHNAVNIDDKGFMSVNYIQVLVAKVASLEKQLKQLQNGI